MIKLNKLYTTMFKAALTDIPEENKKQFEHNRLKIDVTPKQIAAYNKGQVIWSTTNPTTVQHFNQIAEIAEHQLEMNILEQANLTPFEQN